MKQIIALLMLTLPLWGWAAERVILTNASEDVTVTLLESRANRILVRFEVNAFSRESITIDGRNYLQLDVDGEGALLSAGDPALPFLTRSLIIPNDAEMDVHVLDAEYDEFPFSEVAPSKGNLSRAIDPALVPFTFSGVYSSNAWFPAAQAELSEPYILRDLRGTALRVFAFQVNPAETLLRVARSITVEIVPVRDGEINVLTRAESLARVTGQFDQLYRSHFLNYDAQQQTLRYVPVIDEGSMLVITYDAFNATMVPFVQWKIQKGIPTTMVNLSTIGSTSTAIRTYIQNYYNNSGGELAWVLLVGDAAQVPTPQASGGSSDPTYAKVAGGDDYPDIFIGRFSAETVAQVQTQVERSVEYEREPEAGAAWWHLATGVASAEGPGHSSEYDYQHMNLVRTDLLTFTFTAIDQIYDPGATAAQVSTALNAGRSLVNYIGHGSNVSWGTTGFSNTNVAALTNENRLPFIYSVACVNGEFESYTCFAEAWTRSTRNGQPIGAVATYMSSINQSWNPPMDAQDEANDLLRTRMRTTVGGVCFNSACRMIDINGADGVDMYNTWHIFGDPSLQLRTDTPAALSVSHDAQIFFGQPSFDVTVAGVSGALCALSCNGVLYGSAYTDASGLASIAPESDLPIGETMQLTVTAFNKLTYTGTVDVVSSGPDIWPPSISFVPQADTDDAAGPYVLTATMRDYSGISSAVFHYGFDGVNFSSRPMTLMSGDDWQVSFGGFPQGTMVYYYFTAVDASENLNSATSATDDFAILGVIFSDAMESGAGGWTSEVITAGWTNQWHLSSEQSHSTGHAWKFGDSGTGNYAVHSYGALISPSVYLRGTASLSFWQQIQSEVSTLYSDSAYDAGVVDIQLDNGAWQQLTALSPAYNKTSRCTAGGSAPYTGPFSCRTPCYAGEVPWTQVSVNLDSYAGHNVRFRFRFGSDNGGAREGWYIDDFTIMGLPEAPPAPQPVTDLHVIASPDSIQFIWSPTGAPTYKLFSSQTIDGLFETLEATTSDSTVTIPATNDVRFYILRSVW